MDQFIQKKKNFSEIFCSIKDQHKQNPVAQQFCSHQNDVA